MVLSHALERGSPSPTSNSIPFFLAYSVSYSRKCPNVPPSHHILVPMRLLNTATLAFEEFFGEVGNGIPHYAILSHTWGPDEVSYRDHVDRSGFSRQGWAKVRDSSKLANEEGFKYLWIDTCLWSVNVPISRSLTTKGQPPLSPT
jgi:hypothetical protein